MVATQTKSTIKSISTSKKNVEISALFFILMGSWI